MPYFAVIGRIPGDDEDTAMVLECESKPLALATFEDEMYAWYDDADDRKDAMERAHGHTVFINQVLRSDTPIEVV